MQEVFELSIDHQRKGKTRCENKGSRDHPVEQIEIMKPGCAANRSENRRVADMPLDHDQNGEPPEHVDELQPGFFSHVSTSWARKSRTARRLGLPTEA